MKTMDLTKQYVLLDENLKEHIPDIIDLQNRKIMTTDGGVFDIDSNIILTPKIDRTFEPSFSYKVI